MTAAPPPIDYLAGLQVDEFGSKPLLRLPVAFYRAWLGLAELGHTNIMARVHATVESVVKTILPTVLLSLAVASPAFAATDFEYTAIGTDTGGAWIKLDGHNIGATSSTVVSTATGPDGKAQASNGHCQSWTPDPSGAYAIETVCNYTNPDGTYSTISWCPTDTSKECTGKLVGVSGAFVNKNGTFSVQTKPGADSATDNYSGTGHWD